MAILHHLGPQRLHRAWQQHLKVIRSIWTCVETPSMHGQLLKHRPLIIGTLSKLMPIWTARICGCIPEIIDLPTRCWRPCFALIRWACRALVELCGVQHLMPKVTFDTDKIMAKGSRTIGAFVTFPAPDSLMRAITGDSLAPFQEWLAVADKNKPLVICEGVATGILRFNKVVRATHFAPYRLSNVMAVANGSRKPACRTCFQVSSLQPITTLAAMQPEDSNRMPSHVPWRLPR